MHRTFSLVALAVIGLFASATSTASAQTTRTVCPWCEYTSINVAIDESSDGDTIQLLPLTYAEGAPINTDGKAVTILGVGLLDVPLTILDGGGLDGGGSHRVLECVNGEGEDTVFQHLLIRNGHSTSTIWDQYHGGGGMINMGSSPTLRFCRFEGNRASGTINIGGGIYNRMDGSYDSSNPTLYFCTFESNSAGSGGGM